MNGPRSLPDVLFFALYIGWIIVHAGFGFFLWWWFFNPDTFARISAWYTKDRQRRGNLRTRSARYDISKWGDSSYRKGRVKAWFGKWLIAGLVIAMMVLESLLFHFLYDLFT